LIAKSQPLQFQDLAVNPEPSIPLKSSKGRRNQPLEISIEIKDDLFYADFGKGLNFLLHKRPSSEYNPLKKGSIRKHSKSNSSREHLNKLKGGMSSDATEREPSHLETNPIFFPSMLTTDISSESIFKTILDPDKSPYALSSYSCDDPKNPLRQPKHRNHEGSKENQEEQQQRLEHSCVVASKEWLDEDEALRIEPKPVLDPNGEFKSISLINITHPSLEETLDKINPRVINPRKILDNECHRHEIMETMFSPMDIHEESTLELEKED
jgi:hypothetical protein